jgi:4'-phosphopantetheinyl transferase
MPVALEDGVVIYSAPLDCDHGALQQLENTLAPDERDRAARFRFPVDRNHFICARGILRSLLASHLGINPDQVQFDYGSEGKPKLRGPGSTNLHFNISHSHGVGIFALAYGRNLGIDVEFVQPDFKGEDIAARYFSARELEELRGMPEEQRTEGFFNCWTRKEAYIKADGRGLQIPLDSFDVTLSPEAPPRFLRGVSENWHLAHLAPAQNYVGAVVYDGPPCPIQTVPLVSPADALAISR